MKGRVLAINTGSTSTKIGYFVDETMVFEQNLVHSVSDLAKYSSVMEQDLMRRDAITEFLSQKGIALSDIDIVMARAGLITPVETGVYGVNEAMRRALVEARNGVHACNLSGLIADDIAQEVNEARAACGKDASCRAYIADAAMADEMLPEAKVGGLPEFPRRPLCHALNSRAIDTNDAHGGDGPVSAERAGTVPGFPLVEMCFSGRYTKEEVKKHLVGKGGAVAWFGTNDFREILKMADGGDEKAQVFVKGYCLSVAKYIAGLSVDVYGKVDAIILTGGVAHSSFMMQQIIDRVSFIAPVHVFPGENELESLADNGYRVLSGEFAVKTYSGS